MGPKCVSVLSLCINIGLWENYTEIMKTESRLGIRLGN